MRLWPFEAIAPKDRRVEPESLPHPSGKNRLELGASAARTLDGKRLTFVRYLVDTGRIHD